MKGTSVVAALVIALMVTLVGCDDAVHDANHSSDLPLEDSTTKPVQSGSDVDDSESDVNVDVGDGSLDVEVGDGVDLELGDGEGVNVDVDSDDGTDSSDSR